MKNLSLINKRVETEIFRFFNWFLKIWRSRERYKAERTSKRADSWPTPTSILKVGKKKLVFLPIK